MDIFVPAFFGGFIGYFLGQFLDKLPFYIYLAKNNPERFKCYFGVHTWKTKKGYVVAQKFKDGQPTGKMVKEDRYVKVCSACNKPDIKSLNISENIFGPDLNVVKDKK